MPWKWCSLTLRQKMRIYSSHNQTLIMNFGKVMKTSIKWLLDHSHQHLPHPSYDVHQISIQLPQSHQHLPHPSYDVHQISIQLPQSHQHPSYAAGCLHQY
ncbi:hypothetical protein NQZ68_029253 [Dissostichus eleginoides]|nr:hypothetical protein NQZ68_029253 [Dissostichus eleginoides]